MGSKAEQLFPINKEASLNRQYVADMHTENIIERSPTKADPVFHDSVQKTSIIEEMSPDIGKSRCVDMSYLICRTGCESQHIPGWSGYNRAISKSDAEITTSGFLPIIQHPAHEYDTLNTVIVRSMGIARTLNVPYTVITVDQALYSKMKEIVWAQSEKYSKVIVKLGGLHILMNYLQCIGKHIESSGIEDVWTEAGVYGEGAIHGILKGKSYNRAVRAHKLTYEALWRELCTRHGVQHDDTEIPHLRDGDIVFRTERGSTEC